MSDYLEELVGQHLRNVSFSNGYITLYFEDGFNMMIYNDTTLTLEKRFAEHSEVSRITRSSGEVRIEFGSYGFISIDFNDESFSTPEAFVFKTPAKTYIDK